MTKKDYQLIAEAIREARALEPALGDDTDCYYSDGINAVVDRLAMALAAENARFNPSTFRKATK